LVRTNATTALGPELLTSSTTRMIEYVLHLLPVRFSHYANLNPTLFARQGPTINLWVSPNLYPQSESRARRKQRGGKVSPCCPPNAPNPIRHETQLDAVFPRKGRSFCPSFQEWQPGDIDRTQTAIIKAHYVFRSSNADNFMCNHFKQALGM
jgi:hypothetical protein